MRWYATGYQYGVPRDVNLLWYTTRCQLAMRHVLFFLVLRSGSQIFCIAKREENSVNMYTVFIQVCQKINLSKNIKKAKTKQQNSN